MSKRYVTRAAMIGLVVLVLSFPAMGAAKTMHQCTATSRLAIIEQDYAFPNIGSAAELAQVVEQTCDGRKATPGAGELRLTITGVGGGGGVNSMNTSAGGQVTTGIEFKSDGINYFERGTLKASATGGLTPQPNGAVSIAGEIKFTGGTGLYRGASGSGTISGSTTPNGISTTETKSTLSY
jgi:hypothetical protein